ncbi:mediator of RNA polymerase II transcription subunit 16 [Aspergillus awamori]|uniref:Mediator of RNA polymerase II transcription subunit 16 n=2 Tax=Aspergillus TaxID=5052 RepID=A0A3F3QIY9_9EURO|nr:mediator complex, subunit Med16 [Aspergillus welwitschiae]RDH38909.1 mediator complex, subunit Med16 [Aspergillus welwitschiae]GCB22497.1 mediator of RNA polymerase II transcription subunit 16 [Aspergillus awamori]GKZ53552.1 mediator complex subunit [Aspergillus niger]
MPLMMDDSINVDDLFGEPTSLELGLPPSASPARGLAQRLDEMRLLGCCQKIAWSKLGCIAYISQDSLRVKVRHLQCRPSDGKWVLSDETPLMPITEAHGGHALTHLSWNEAGSDLAVVDVTGRVSVYHIPFALNSVNGLRQPAFSPDDGSQIVGMMWLNTQRSVHAFYQAAKVQGRWAYSPFRRRPIGPFHPANKAALLCITRSGSMKLLYQNPDGRWDDISVDLKSTSYSDRLLSHAAMVATQNGILVATYSVCQKIRFYRVQINWNPPQWDPAQQPKQTPPQFPVPSFRFTHSKVETSCTVPGMHRNDGEEPDMMHQSISNPLYTLSRLDIILPASDNAAGTTANPWIVAVFSTPPQATPDHPGPQGPASVIVRWQLDTAAFTLHPKFDEMAAKRNSTQIKPRPVLRRLEDIYSDRYVISVDQIEYGNVVAITYDDSSVSFYDPKTMALFNGVDDANTVTGLAQAGFHYAPDASGQGQHVSFSPSACAAVMLDSDGQTHLRVMEHSYGAENGLYDENKFSAAIASLTLAFCRGCGSEVNTDDILLILIQQLSQDAQITFINEVYRALPINCNFTVEQEKLMNHPYIPKCLSIQAALGFADKYKPRSFASSVSWSILQLRHAAILYPFFFQYNKGIQAEPHDPDVLRMMLGNTRWALDFSLYILNELFDLADDFESVSADQEAFSQKLKTTNSLALIILLSSMSRAFLRFICRGLRGIHAGYTNASLGGDSRLQYAEICQALDATPARIDVYEKFLSAVDSAVRHAYHGAGFGDTERPGPEKELLVNARIPPVLVAAVSTILRQTVPGLKSEVDRMAIYMHDYSWLGFGSDRRSELYRRTREVDIIKKTPIRMTITQGSNGPQLGKQNNQGVLRRRCVRCCDVSEGTYPPRSVLAFRMIFKLGHLRSCICGGMWTLESGLNEAGK